ncbi:MAG: hypothetical protein MUC47_03775 [Candidatus Kapabacteria bacterium]|nr:hypothetical protein [Candidatus Kapabacteria bacterium]
MTRSIIPVVVLLCTFLFTGCSTEEPEYVAERLTVEELNTSAGFIWFPAETSLYQPNPVKVSEVRDNFTSSTKAVIFVRPTCSCRGTQKLFPQVVKTLMEANVPMDRVEIYSVRSTRDQHPYQDRITLNELPAVFIGRSDTITVGFVEADYTGFNADTLVARALLRR